MKLKFLTTLLSLVAFTLTVTAQERWTVQLNSKTLLNANTEDTATNVVALNDIKKGSLLVTYVPGKVVGERKRRLMIFDANDQELYSKEAFSIAVPAASLKKWRLTTPFVKVYTMPVLGAEGATMRLRRIHLCTINFE